MVTFLLDNNLPPSLCEWLKSFGILACHVQELGLDKSNDPMVWRYATENGFAILTKDRDFDRFAAQSRLMLLPVFRLEVGNATKASLYSWLEPRLRILMDFQSGSEYPYGLTWPSVVLIN